MCGIAGFLGRGRSRDELQARIGPMLSAIRHRGPDASGTWFSQDPPLVLGHQRLSILDLSEAGAQPMVSQDGRYVLAFNGEVYNFQELREELEAEGEIEGWRGHSDTEVLLRCFQRWGFSTSLRRFNGMFALALWDRQEATLTLARDRLGIKPLYFGRNQEGFFFSSEMSSFRTLPGARFRPDPLGIRLFLRFKYIPAPATILQEVSKLPPGGWLRIRAGDNFAYSLEGQTELSDEPGPSVRRFWRFTDAIRDGLQAPLPGGQVEHDEALAAALERSIRYRMISDVPLGAFLSGGIDSSLVTSLMQASSGHPVRTFSIGFRVAALDEAPHARAIADHLGTEHTELYVTDQDALEVVPRLPDMFDEPFSDSSQIPTFLVSRMAREHVTVSLSGDGGDELFGGYSRFFRFRSLLRRLGKLPLALRRGAGGLLSNTLVRMGLEGLDRTLGHLPVSTPSVSGERAHRLGALLSAREESRAYLEATLWSWRDPPVLSEAQGDDLEGVLLPFPEELGDDLLSRMMAVDSQIYLTHDILTKVDRASMAVSLEARVPLLDHNVVELAWRLPIASKAGPEEQGGKAILKRLLARHVPRELFEREKQGFGVPLASWLRGPLRDWAGDLLSPETLRRQGLLREESVSGLWKRHQAGTQNSPDQLWSLAMFQAWRDHWDPVLCE